MKGLFHLAWCHLTYHWRASLLSLLCLSTTIFLPLATNRLSRDFERSLVARSASTPLVCGVRGNRFDLTMAALYFRASELDALQFGELELLRESPLDLVIPLNVRHRARGVPVVSTSPEYFEQRGLVPEEGSLPLWIGECVLGAEALAGELAPGDTVFTDARQGYDLAGPAPLELKVTGRLAATGGPDDRAVFTTVATGWMLEGALHGHDEVTELDTSMLLGGDEEGLVVGPALVEERSATESNRRDFHMHADRRTLPLTAALVFPSNEKTSTMLKARLDASPRLRAIDPTDVVSELLGLVFRIRDLLEGFAFVLGGTTVLMGVLVILLGLRLRAGELRTLERMGASRGFALQLVAMETALVLLGALALAMGALSALPWDTEDLLRWIS